MRELPRSGQISVIGNVVNVPSDVNKTTRVLPRKHNDNARILVKLKWRLAYKQHYLYEFIRPNKVIEAIMWLTKTNRKGGNIIEDKWEVNLNANEENTHTDLVTEVKVNDDDDDDDDDDDNKKENSDNKWKIQKMVQILDH